VGLGTSPSAGRTVMEVTSPARMCRGTRALALQCLVTLWGDRGHRFETVGIDASMSHDARQHSPTGHGPLIIEPGSEDDLPAITDILNYAIMNSNATLAAEPVTIDERREWLGRFSVTGPYRLLVARRGGQVLGYAASLPYREHEGFRETVEVSIALGVTSRGQGVGTALYRALLGCLAGEPVHVALAGIVLPNEASVALHRKLGFTEGKQLARYPGLRAQAEAVRAGGAAA
jgi:phosphinothricin acetyltransferase